MVGHRRRGADVDDLDRREAPTADALGKRQQMVLAALRVHPALEARRGAAKDDDRALGAGADDRDLACVIAWCFALLVARLVLLVDDDRAEIRERREDRRARADGDALLAASQCQPGVVPLAVAQRAVEHGHAIAEGRAKAIDRLRRERDLGNEHDRALVARIDQRAQQFDVDERLATAGDAVQQKRFTRPPGAHCIDRVLLRCRRHERRRRRHQPR